MKRTKAPYDAHIEIKYHAKIFGRNPHVLSQAIALSGLYSFRHPNAARTFAGGPVVSQVAS